MGSQTSSDYAKLTQTKSKRIALIEMVDSVVIAHQRIVGLAVLPISTAENRCPHATDRRRMAIYRGRARQRRVERTPQHTAFLFRRIADAVPATTWRTRVRCCDDDTSRRQHVVWLVLAARRNDGILAILPHDLRGLLGPITVAAVPMRKFESINLQQADTHTFMQLQRRHMRHSVDDLLNVGRVNSGKLSISLWLSSLLQVVQQAPESTPLALAAAQHRLDFNAPVIDTAVRGEPHRLGQALVNVIDNTAKFIPNGCTIQVQVTQCTRQASITVVNNVDDIRAAFQPRLLVAFTQMKQSLARSWGGLGIVLALTRQVMLLRGGTITAPSNGIDCGSIFTLVLPLADQPLQQLEEPTVAVTIPNKQGFKILLIDDNEDANDSMAALLELLEYDVRTAVDGASALQLTAEFKPQLILSDIGLPGLDGYQLAPALRKVAGQRKLIIAAATGYGHASDRARALAAGFDHHLVKPLDADVLLDFVAQQAAGY